MVRVRLLIVALAGMLVLSAVAVGPADAKVKPRFKRAYKAQVNAAEQGTDSLRFGVDDSISVLYDLGDDCQSPDPVVRQMARTAAGYLNKTMNRNLDNSHPKRMFRGYTKKSWYTKPDRDLKVVRRGVRKLREGVLWIEEGWANLAVGSGMIMDGNCEIGKSARYAQYKNWKAEDRFDAGLELLRSRLR